jgi:hypothetical protein
LKERGGVHGAPFREGRGSGWKGVGSAARSQDDSGTPVRLRPKNQPSERKLGGLFSLFPHKHIVASFKEQLFDYRQIKIRRLK